MPSQLSTPGKYTLIGSWALLIGKALDSYGLDGNKLCKQFGVDLLEAADPDSRFSSSQLGILWESAAEISGDPAFGLRAGTLVGPSTFRALSVSMWMSANLLEAFERVVHYSGMFATTGNAELTDLKDRFRFSIHLERGEDGNIVTSLHSTDALMAAYITFCRMLYKADFKPLAVDLIRSHTEFPGQYHEFFACPVNFGCRSLSIYFDKKSATDTLASADAKMASHADQEIVNYLSRMERDDIVSQVQSRVLELLPLGGFSRERVARSLNMSLSKLQKQLHSRGTSYQQELEKTRMSRAAHYLQQADLSVGEIGYLLGFSSTASFSRAFKRWTGNSPTCYRVARRKRPNRLNT